MVKFHESTFSHAYPFETVTLAYFLRYPNPYSTHVLTTDTIARHFDVANQTLYTARIHLKRSKIPSAVLKLLPTSWLGAGASTTGTSQSYVLERSIVDVRNGVMVTESRNLDLTGVLKVVERQLYRRPSLDLTMFFGNVYAARQRQGFRLATPDWSRLVRRQGIDAEETEVSTKVELISVLGDGGKKFRRSRAKQTDEAQDASDENSATGAPPQKMGFFRAWSMASIQKSIEAIGLRRTERAVPNSKKGMNIVLDRLRNGGLVAVFEGMRMDRERALAGHLPDRE